MAWNPISLHKHYSGGIGSTGAHEKKPLRPKSEGL